MYAIDEHISIPKNVATQDGLDFAFLKDKGIEHIERLGRQLWTNYNISDSGIAFLEVLIYGITDLEHRISQPIADLVTTEKDSLINAKKQFHTAKDILTTAPVTANDYRKLLIDIDGVKNAWLLKYSLPIYTLCNPEEPKFSFKPFTSDFFGTTSFNVKGIYTILIDFDDEMYDAEGVQMPTKKLQVYNEVIKRFHANRNLCEDVGELKEVPEKKIKVCGRIQIEDEADEELVHANIRFLIEEYLSPSLGTYTLQQMLDKGIATEDIFDGPQLENGFIDNDELKKSELRREVRLSDIIQQIMSVPGVKYIEEIQILPCEMPKNKKDGCCPPTSQMVGDDWIICIPPGYKASYCEESNLQYKKYFLPVGVNASRSKKYLEELRSAAYNRSQKISEDLPFPLGQYADFAQYSTLQNNLPETYGLGFNGLPPNVTAERKAQALQLKGYLLGMEQVLATYFSQLGQLGKLLSHQIKETETANYGVNAIQDLRELEKLVGNDVQYKNVLNTELKNIDDFAVRRNEFLNHLLARFGEAYTNYASVMNDIFGEDYLLPAIKAKNDYYEHIATLSYNRYRAFDYTHPASWDTNNIHGLQNKLSHYLGIQNKTRRDMYPAPTGGTPAENDLASEGLYAIENTLLLPTKPLMFATEFVSGQFVYVFKTDGNGLPTNYKWKVKIAGIAVESERLYSTDEEAQADFENSIRYMSNGIFKEEKNGRFHLLWCSEEYATDKKEKWIIAKSINDYTSDYINARIDALQLSIKQDAFDLKCFSFSFIDKRDSNLAMGDCSHCVDAHCHSCSPIDYFSYRMTFVFPGWTKRFRNQGFRKFVENKIYEMLPAHILPRICWVGYPQTPTDTTIINDMQELQNAWHEYLQWKSYPNHNMALYPDLSYRLLCIMNNLNNLYDEGFLHDCENDETEDKKKIILNQSTLGTLNNIEL